MSDTFDHELEAFERWENGERDGQQFFVQEDDNIFYDSKDVDDQDDLPF